MKSNLSLSSAVAGIVIVVLGIFLGQLTWSDSYTADEKAHMAASVTYVNDLSLALNAEHPPLMKVLSGLSTLIFAKPTLPSLQETTALGTNRQYEHGDAILNANLDKHDALIIYSRLPMVILTLVFAYVFYRFARQRFGEWPAVGALTLLAFSPTIIGHGHLVTFDVAAAFGYFIAILSFAAFLEDPSKKRFITASLCLATALLIKFSAIILIPIYLIGLLVWRYVARPSNVSMLIKGTAGIVGISAVIVYLFYFVLTIGYPPSDNKKDVLAITAHYPYQALQRFNAELAGTRITQPLGAYIVGANQTTNRARGGNPTYFKGTVENYGTPAYFPTLLVTKESLPAILLAVIALAISISRLWQKKWHIDWRDVIKKNPAEVLMVFTVVIYWLTALTSTLNIGYRHVLPTLPLIFFLVAAGLQTLFKDSRRIVQAALILLFSWVVIEPIAQYPNILNYYNQLAGGDEKGYELAVDSNYDWGQDLRRLGAYVNEKGIDHIALDYFGGDLPSYYLGARYEPWQSSYGPPIGWFAISANTRQNAMMPHGSDLPIEPIHTYRWLIDKEPIARIGSIFIYHF